MELRWQSFKQDSFKEKHLSFIAAIMKNSLVISCFKIPQKVLNYIKSFPEILHKKQTVRWVVGNTFLRSRNMEKDF